MRVFIHGSCVSRDLLTLLQNDGFELSFYSPRQSLIPLLGHVQGLETHLDATKLTSRFQRRALEGTLEADLLQQLEQHASSTDMVLWDLTDERLGVYEYGGAYMTRSLELISSGLDDVLAQHARHIPFGDDEHFGLWSRALQEWAASLETRGLADRVVLLAPRWASTAEDGRSIPPSYGVSTERHTELAQRYYDAARATVPGLRVVGAATETYGSYEHQWGPAPFHYSEATNRVFAEELHRLVFTAEQQFPPPFPTVLFRNGGEVVIHTARSWADDIALHVRNERHIVEKHPYQQEDRFRVRLPEAGTYQFRVFHRSGELRVGVSSAMYQVPGVTETSPR
jgi:hypothetical protein